MALSLRATTSTASTTAPLLLLPVGLTLLLPHTYLTTTPLLLTQVHTSCHINIHTPAHHHTTQAPTRPGRRPGLPQIPMVLPPLPLGTSLRTPPWLKLLLLRCTSWARLLPRSPLRMLRSRPCSASAFLPTISSFRTSQAPTPSSGARSSMAAGLFESKTISSRAMSVRVLGSVILPVAITITFDLRSEPTHSLTGTRIELGRKNTSLLGPTEIKTRSSL
jgi:hypothetical protein